MPKLKKLFSIKNNNKKINMNVDGYLFNHFQTLTPLQQRQCKINDIKIIKTERTIII